MNKRVTIFVMVSMVLFSCEVAAQEEIYEFDAGSGRRAGKATLRIEPDLTTKRSNIYFTTT